MKIEKLYEITIDTSEIITATLSKYNEIVWLNSEGQIHKYKLEEGDKIPLFSVVETGIRYTDGGFDKTARSTIYTLDDIIVVVNDYKTHGFIYYPDKYPVLHISRGDYFANITKYPVALFKNEEDVPHIIYGKDWNHIQIMNLDTRQILTAAKSLIEENAEEKHIEFYEKHTEDNKLPWPSAYDYFFGELYICPNQKYFLSAGWAWGSCDAFNIYNVEHFIQSNRIKDIYLGGWEHSDKRAVCWVNDEIIAVGYEPVFEGDKDANEDTSHEIHLYKFADEQTEFVEKIKIENLPIAYSTIQYSEQLQALVAFSDETGVAVISLDGTIQYQNKDLRVNSFYKSHNLFLSYNDCVVSVYQIT